MARAYDVVKSVDPTIQVGLCAASVNLNFMERAIRAGAADHFDYVALHPYETLSLLDRGFEPLFLAIVPTVRRMLAAANPARAQVPIAFTELGEPVGGAITAAHQADTVIKSYVLSIVQGVAQVHWFEGLDGDSGPFGLIAAGGARRPSYTAMSTLVAALGPVPRYWGPLWTGGAHPGFVFEGADGPVVVAWARPGAAPTLDLGGGATLIDPRTGARTTASSVTLTASPVIVLGAPRTFVAEAVSRRARPTPWDGDFTAAAQVTYAATPGGEQGLHPLGAAPVVTVDGQVARDCSASGGHAFAIDPNFLSYTATRVRVTAVVRRKGAASAGFNLKYEAVSGYRGTGAWTNVPDGAGWHTLTWDVLDPQPVGKWGYHLALDSDSTMFSGYLLASLTVARV